MSAQMLYSSQDYGHTDSIEMKKTHVET
jgi:hypothetical protein